MASYWNNTGGTLRDDVGLWDTLRYYTTGIKVPPTTDVTSESNMNTMDYTGIDPTAISTGGSIPEAGSIFSNIMPEGFGWNKGTLDTVAALGKVWTGYEANKTAQDQVDLMRQQLGHQTELDKLNAAMQYHTAQSALDTRAHNLAARGITDIPLYELPDSPFKPEFTQVT